MLKRAECPREESAARGLAPWRLQKLTNDPVMSMKTKDNDIKSRLRGNKGPKGETLDSTRRPGHSPEGGLGTRRLQKLTNDPVMSMKTKDNDIMSSQGESDNSEVASRDPTRSPGHSPEGGLGTRRLQKSTNDPVMSMKTKDNDIMSPHGGSKGSKGARLDPTGSPGRTPGTGRGLGTVATIIAYLSGCAPSSEKHATVHFEVGAATIVRQTAEEVGRSARPSSDSVCASGGRYPPEVIEIPGRRS